MTKQVATVGFPTVAFVPFTDVLEGGDTIFDSDLHIPGPPLQAGGQIAFVDGIGPLRDGETTHAYPAASDTNF